MLCFDLYRRRVLLQSMRGESHLLALHAPPRDAQLTSKEFSSRVLNTEYAELTPAMLGSGSKMLRLAEMALPLTLAFVRPRMWGKPAYSKHRAPGITNSCNGKCKHVCIFFLS